MAVHVRELVSDRGSKYVYIDVTQAWKFMPILMFNLDFYYFIPFVIILLHRKVPHFVYHEFGSE